MCGPEVVEHLRRAVAIRHEARHQSSLARCLEDRHAPLGGNERLVVGADHHTRALIERGADQTLRRGGSRQGHRLRVAQRLRRHPVLAVAAVQVAAEHPEAEGQGTRNGVKERFLLDRIALHAADITPRRVELSVPDAADLADADGALRNGAAMPAGQAANPLLVDALGELTRSGARPLVEHVLEGGHLQVVAPGGAVRKGRR